MAKGLREILIELVYETNKYGVSGVLRDRDKNLEKAINQIVGLLPKEKCHITLNTQVKLRCDICSLKDRCKLKIKNQTVADIKKRLGV